MTPGTLYPDLVLTELRLRHFRAFENARLVLDPMTLLVGRNGSGKSTIMEALDFLRDAVTDSLVNALERRGGLRALRQRQSGRVAPYDVSVAVVLRYEGKPVLYGSRMGSKRGGSGFSVKEEVLQGGGPRLSPHWAGGSWPTWTTCGPRGCSPRPPGDPTRPRLTRCEAASHGWPG